MKKVLAVAVAVGLMSFGASALTIGGVQVGTAPGSELSLWEIITDLAGVDTLSMSEAGNCSPTAYDGTFSQDFVYTWVAKYASNTQILSWYATDGSASGLLDHDGPYSPGTEFGFQLNSNQAVWTSEDGVASNGGNVHMLLFDIGGKTYMAWEDQNLGDHDYNDFVAEVIFRPCGDDPVPEPATLSLLGIGLAGLVMRRRRG